MELYGLSDAEAARSVCKKSLPLREQVTRLKQNC